MRELMINKFSKSNVTRCFLNKICIELKKRDFLCFFSRFTPSSVKPFFFQNNVAIEKNFAARQWTLRGVSPVARDRFYRISPWIVRTFSGHAREKNVVPLRTYIRLPIRKLAGHTQKHHCYPRFICIRFHASFFRIVGLDLRACFLSTFIREIYGLSFFFLFYFKILGIALRSLSALINGREEVYVSLTSEYLHTKMETREKQGRTRTRLSSSTSSVIRLKIRVGITVDLRNRMRK